MVAHNHIFCYTFFEDIIMKNKIIFVKHVGCKVKQNYNFIYIDVKDSESLFINKITICNYEFLYSDNKDRYSVKIYYTRGGYSLLEIDNKMFNILKFLLS